MILQTRYYQLLDFSNVEGSVTIQDIIKQVPLEVYQAGKSRPNSFQSVHEVAFDSKGKKSSNLSLWFDATITACTSSKAKKVSKKDEPWQLENGSLFCAPRNEEFLEHRPITEPYIFMQPVDDCKEGHDLVISIIKHRIASILHSRGFRFDEILAQHDDADYDLLRDEMGYGPLGVRYSLLKADLARWAVSPSIQRHFALFYAALSH